jgi:Coenzyme PQQ synthesis protein D (PqqD)
VRYRAIPEALVATLSDGAVLLNLQTKRYFSLNETGTRIWELVQQAAEEESIVATMIREYEVDEATASTEVRRILDELIEAQLIVLA